MIDLKKMSEIRLRSSTASVAERLDEDERAKLDLGRQGEGNVINESVLYMSSFTQSKFGFSARAYK